MALTECTAWATRRLQDLRGGERQRVLLARLFRHLAARHTEVTVLHDLPIAVHADRLLLLRQGLPVADGPATQPAPQQALGQVFGGAVRLRATGGVPRVEPVLD